jgi:hypothetical protein
MCFLAFSRAIYFAFYTTNIHISAHHSFPNLEHNILTKNITELVENRIDHDGDRFGCYSSSTERREGLCDWGDWMARCQV